MKITIVLLVVVSLSLGLYIITNGEKEANLEAVITENETALTETTDFAATLNEVLIKTQAGHLISSANALTLAFKLNSLAHNKDKEGVSVVRGYESKEVLLTLQKMRPPLSAYNNFPIDDFDKNVEIITQSIQGNASEVAIRKLYEVASGVNTFIQENEMDKKAKKPRPIKKPPSSPAFTLVASNGR